MNINPASAYNAYKAMERSATPHQAVQPHTESVAAKTENTDQIHISPEGARQLDIEKAAKSIMDEIQEPASPERLEALKRSVQDKTYHIPTNDLVDAVMKRWFEG